MQQKQSTHFFHKPIKKDTIPLAFLKLKICNNEIKQSESITFLGAFLEKKLSWKDHMKSTENKIAKNSLIV